MAVVWNLGRVSLWLVGAALLAACAPTLTTVREHPDLARAERPLQRLLLLPADVEVQRIVFNGDNARLTDKETAMARQLAVTVRPLFERRGYEVQDLDLDLATAESPDLRFSLEQVRTAYNKASGQLYQKAALPKEQQASIRTSLGPIVNGLAEYGHADALVLVRCAAFEKSGGVIAKDIMAATLLAALTGVAAMSPNEGIMAELALVDGTTGDVLWTNVQTIAQASEPNLETLLTELPRARPRPPVTPSPALASASGSTVVVPQPSPDAGDSEPVAEPEKSAPAVTSGTKEATVRPGQVSVTP